MKVLHQVISYYRMPLIKEISVMLCPWLYHLCLREVTSSSTHQIFWDSSHLWWLLCSPVYYLHGHFSSLRHIRTAHPQQPLMLWLEHQHWALFIFLKFCSSNSMKHNILWQHAFRQVGWSSSSCLGPALRTRLADQHPLQRLNEQHARPFSQSVTTASVVVSLKSHNAYERIRI